MFQLLTIQLIREINTVKLRKDAKEISHSESKQTNDLMFPQLQSIAVLQQMKLKKLQLEKEKILLDDSMGDQPR